MTDPSTEAFFPTIRSEQASARGALQAESARIEAARSDVFFIVQLLLAESE